MALTNAAAPPSPTPSDRSATTNDSSLPPQTPVTANETASSNAGGVKRTVKSGRRANTAERRATHNAVERARRETLNGRFLDLAGMLPNLSQIRRPSKSAIVNSTIAHISAARRHRLLAAQHLRGLKHECDALRAEANEWRARAGVPAAEEPRRGEAFSVVLSGELEWFEMEGDLGALDLDEVDELDEQDDADEANPRPPQHQTIAIGPPQRQSRSPPHYVASPPQYVPQGQSPPHYATNSPPNYSPAAVQTQMPPVPVKTGFEQSPVQIYDHPGFDAHATYPSSYEAQPVYEPHQHNPALLYEQHARQLAQHQQMALQGW